MKYVLTRIKAGLLFVIYKIFHPKINTLAMAVLVLILIGVVFYTWQEDWSITDSLYFSIVALTTIGFGDFTPTTTTTRMFTIVYALTGIGILGIAINTIVRNQQRRVQRRQGRNASDDLNFDSEMNQDEGEQSIGNAPAGLDLEDRVAQLEREIGLIRQSSGSGDSEIQSYFVRQSAELAAISQQVQAIAEELRKQTTK